MNTKARHLEIYAAAQAELAKVGGVEVLDAMNLDERQPLFRQIAKSIQAETSCHYDTAKNNLAKAMRRARGEIMKASWGGSRGGGRPPKEK